MIKFHGYTHNIFSVEQKIGEHTRSINIVHLSETVATDYRKITNVTIALSH